MEQTWKKQLMYDGYQYATSIATDNNNNVYITGYTEGYLGDDLNGESKGGDDVFLAKYDSAGGQIWRKK